MKRTLLLFLLVIFPAIFLGGCQLPFLGKKKNGGLQVNSSPKAAVFLDGNSIGSTPFFDENLKPGEFLLKLVPEESNLPAWETRIRINPGSVTAVNREFGESLEKSSGYVIFLEPQTDKKNASLVIVTDPDGAVVNFDGEPKDFAPTTIDGVSEGEHLLVISSPGYIEKSIRAKAVAGYKLTATVTLAGGEEASPSAEISKEEEKEPSSAPVSTGATEGEEEATESGKVLEKPYVKITQTPTGWLNVRSEPSTAKGQGTVVTKVYPNQTFPFIEKTQNGWYKIEYQSGKQGWITGQYAQLFE